MRRGAVVTVAFGLFVLVALAAQLPAQISAAAEAAPVAAWWDRPDEQYRTTIGEAPYDLLRIADGRMPADAVVLLVTEGTDVRQRDYTTFHRALSLLAPRPVHWITPAPGDGTWEARWWRTAPASVASICEEARRAAATHILYVDLVPEAAPCPDRSWTVASLPSGALVGPVVSGVAGDDAPSTGPPASWPISLALALAVPMALGAALVALALRHGPRLSFGHRAVLAWIFGTGSVTLSAFGLGLLGIPQQGRLALIGAAALAAAIWVGRRRVTGLPDLRRLRTIRPAAAAMLVVLACEVALVALLALGVPLSIWDGWAHWGMKARVIFLEGGVTPAVYADVTRASTLLDSPLHLPILEAWVYGWLGVVDERLVGVLGLATFVALLTLCQATMRRWGAGSAESLAVAAIVGSIPFVWRLAAAGYADVAVALLVTAATVHIVAWLESGARGDLVTAAVAAGLLGWTKKEGLVLLAVLVAVSALAAVWGQGANLRRRARRAMAALVAAGILLAGPWWLFVSVHGIPDVTYGPGLAALPDHIERVPTILAMELSMLAWPEWVFLWPIAALLAFTTAILAVRRRRAGDHADQSDDNDDLQPGSASWILPATAGLSLAALSVAFVVTTYEPYTAQVTSAAYRLALQVLPITVLWIGRRVLTGRDPRPLRPAAADDRSSGSARRGVAPPAPSGAGAGPA